ncbi:MAG: leucyl/phenylalanyl-tRNA--protein transferase [Myxococcales bacterium]|nr:leucyl/phenylalanyl-tRNA--protein transferase [Myxococcales bacterium]
MPRLPIALLGRELRFPAVEQAHESGLLAVGGDLSVERLLLAYGSGIFPWPEKNTPILWWAPPERAIIEPQHLHVGRSLRKLVRRGEFTVRADHDFPAVIRACARIPRRGQRGTWILPAMIDAYIRLHEAGYAHSIEAYRDGVLCGGLYGVSLGGCFFGESMFSQVDNASKVAFVVLAEQLSAWGFDVIDAQVQNDHLERFGVYTIERAAFMIRLRKSLLLPTRKGRWQLDLPMARDDKP